jgi:hypothetical protein
VTDLHPLDPCYLEMYDGYGFVAREAALIVDALTGALHDGLPLTNLAALLAEALRRAERIHGVAAAERERWA